MGVQWWKPRKRHQWKRLPAPTANTSRRNDRVGSRRLRAVTLPHHRTCGFPHPAVEPGSGLAHCVLPWSPMAFHSALLHFISPGAGSLPIARFLQADPLLYSPLADLSGKCALGSLLDCFGKLLAPLPEFVQLVCLLVLWPFAPSGFHRLSSLLRPLLTSTRLSPGRSPRVRCPMFRPVSSGSTSCVFR